jgi:hypothetical protein
LNFTRTSCCTTTILELCIFVALYFEVVHSFLLTLRPPSSDDPHSHHEPSSFFVLPYINLKMSTAVYSETFEQFELTILLNP